MEMLNNEVRGVALGDWLVSTARGEVGCGAAVAITAETPADIAARDALLDRAMGPNWRRKSSEKLRRGRLPAEGLAFVARDVSVVGTVRLWNVALGISPLAGEMAAKQPEGVCAAARDLSSSLVAEKRLSTAEATPPPAFGRTLPSRGRESSTLLLGPLAVDPALKHAGIGTTLMQHAIAEAKRLGHGAILLVGDAPYYKRFGFTAEATGNLSMPGPYEKHRLLALELVPGALEGVSGVLTATGRKMKSGGVAVAA